MCYEYNILFSRSESRQLATQVQAAPPHLWIIENVIPRGGLQRRSLARDESAARAVGAPSLGGALVSHVLRSHTKHGDISHTDTDTGIHLHTHTHTHTNTHKTVVLSHVTCVVVVLSRVTPLPRTRQARCLLRSPPPAATPRSRRPSLCRHPSRFRSRS